MALAMARGRRDDRNFANTPNAERMVRVGDLHHNGLDHGQIQRGGHTIVQQAGIDQMALVVVDILFIQGPTDSLNDTALDLALHIAGMDSLADILHGGVAIGS